MDSWATERKKKLMEELNSFIKVHPECINEFMQVCTDYLTEFRAKCQVDLNSKSAMAIEMLLSGLSPRENGDITLNQLADTQKVAYLIGAMKFTYPKGLESVWTGNKDMMDLFLNLVKKEDTLNKHEFWLQHNGHYDWLKMLMDQVNHK